MFIVIPEPAVKPLHPDYCIGMIIHLHKSGLNDQGFRYAIQAGVFDGKAASEFHILDRGDPLKDV